MKVFSNFTRYFFIPYSILPHYLLLLKASHDYDEIEAQVKWVKESPLFWGCHLPWEPHLPSHDDKFHDNEIPFSYQKPQGCGPDR